MFDQSKIEEKPDGLPNNFDCIFYKSEFKHRSENKVNEEQEKNLFSSLVEVWKSEAVDAMCFQNPNLKISSAWKDCLNLFNKLEYMGKKKKKKCESSIFR